MSLALFDTHCHLDYPPLLENAAEYLLQGAAQGITQTMVPATTASRYESLVALVNRFASLRLALGLHPCYLDEHDDKAIAQTQAAVACHHPVAIGEIGLDYYVDTLDKTRQQTVFEHMIDVAVQHHLPLVLHIRRSHDAAIATLRRKRFEWGGIVHAFAGSEEQAKQWIKLGFVLGFGGVMSYERATRVRGLAASLSLRDIVLETDAPDMVPAQWAQTFNTPLALLNNFHTLCALRNESPELIAQATTQNACRVLNL